MPRVSQFYGITIAMYYSDHAPPHPHALYAGAEAVIDLRSLAVIEGRLPRRAMSLVTEWARLHHREIEANWYKAREGSPLDKIDGLD